MISTYRQAKAYIDTFINLERGHDPFSKRTYRLDRMEFVLALFGNPQDAFQSFHVAGSKGKGSTAVMVASVLEAAGFRVGLFTSPHLLNIRERFCVNRKPIALSLFLSLINEIKEVLDPLEVTRFPGGIQPTFFEMMTLLGFLAFRRQACRYVVLETGLGGRLDATNVVRPLAALLTLIEMEHEDILGDTIEKIAWEKCGIIKAGIPVFSSAQSPVVKDVISRYARGKEAPLMFVDDQVTFSDVSTTLRKTEATLHARFSHSFSVRLSLIGDFQVENAALAFLAVKKVFPDMALASFLTGLEQASLPGRMEFVGEAPPMILDGAHTPRSIARSANCFCGLFPEHPRILLFASVIGKKHREMAATLAPLFDWIVVSTPGVFKKSDPEAVFNAFQSVHSRVIFLRKPKLALAEAYARAAETHPIFVTGSFYFLAEIKRLLKK